MSQATEAKSAKARATIACRMLKTQKHLGRSFDDCLEMGDGDAVYLAIVRRSDIDIDLRDAIVKKGFGYWLEADYRQHYEQKAVTGT